MDFSWWQSFSAAGELVLVLGNECGFIFYVLSCRILIFPWFYLVYGRSRGLSVLEAVLSAPYTCSLFMLVVFLPQLHWFRLMVIGAMKVLKERNSAPVVLNNGCNGKKHLWFENGSKCFSAKAHRSPWLIVPKYWHVYSIVLPESQRYRLVLHNLIICDEAQAYLSYLHLMVICKIKTQKLLKCISGLLIELPLVFS